YPLPIIVRAGSSTQGSGGVVVPVSGIEIHPDYNSSSINNDIAVLTLTFNLTEGPTIGPISLPNVNEEVSTGTPVVVSGWGTLTEGGYTSTQLQAVTVYIVDWNECNTVYEGSLTDRMICAGVPEGGKDSCQGDSGGPLVASGKLVGIVSWGNGCARSGYPGVYTDVAAPAIRLHSEVPQLDGRIVGGEAIDIEEIPYQVSVLHLGSHICGGSIISPKYVVTAGHCTFGFLALFMSVRAGSSIKGSGGEVVRVQRLKRHRRFNFLNIDYDIAILILKHDLALGAPIPLPTDNQVIPPDTPARVSGWGRLKEGGSSVKQLQAVTVNIVNQDKCRDAYGKRKITDRMLCAGVPEGGKDACQYAKNISKRPKYAKLASNIMLKCHTAARMLTSLLPAIACTDYLRKLVSVSASMLVSAA
ncbi:hypothetical protein ILUMI_19600, partial [Ignelater luminosus]